MTLGRAWLITLAVSIVGFGLAGCGASKQSSAAAPAVPVGPAQCLQDSRLTSVVQLDSKTWRGDHTENGQSDFYAVFINKDSTTAAATQFAHDAVDAVRAQSGRYVVTGPSNAGGALLNIAQGLVDGIATCLRG